MVIDPSNASGSFYGLFVNGSWQEPKQKQHVEMLKFDRYLGTITFTLVGVMQLLLWNVLLNTIHTIAVTRYKNRSMAENLVPIYQTFNFLTQLALMYFGGMRKLLFILAAVILGLCGVSIACIVQWLDGREAIILLHFLMFPVGCCVGCLFGCGFTFAAIMPVNYFGQLSFGMGISGLFTFALWMLLTKLAFDLTVLQELKYAIWITFLICICIYWACAYLFYWTLKKPWASKNIVAAEDPMGLDEPPTNLGGVEHSSLSAEKCHFTSVDTTSEIFEASAGERTQPLRRRSSARMSVNTPVDADAVIPCEFNKPEKSPESIVAESLDSSWKHVLKKSWVQLINTGLTIWISLQIFPVVGPLSWSNLSGAGVDIIMGIFQVADFIGRYAPNAGTMPYIGKLIMIPARTLLLFVLARLIFLPLFFVSHRYPKNAVLGELGYQIVLVLLMAFTNGWIGTLGMIYCPDQVKSDKAKGRAGIAASVVMMVGIVCGLWLSKLYLI